MSGFLIRYLFPHPSLRPPRCSLQAIIAPASQPVLQAAWKL
jgi:hypothetical protein